MADWGSSRKFYESEYWQALSKRVRSHARWTCTRCGSLARSDWDRRRMQAHHVISRPHVPYRTPLDVESNLIALCESCHQKTHGRVSHAAGSAHDNSGSNRPPRPNRPNRPKSFRSGSR